MNHPLITAAERLASAAGPNIFDETVPGAMLALVNAAVSQLGWGTMKYGCETCGFEWDVWLSLGVEGPGSLRDAGLYVASPFTTRCPAWPAMQACSGSMAHVNWGEDKEFEPRLIPSDCARFVLPPTMSGPGEGARLEIPVPALIRARRALNEPGGGGS